MNIYGDRFRMITYGESHGLAVGAVIDGCPAGLHIDMEAIRLALERRRAGAPRTEEDHIEWLSGLKEGVTLGSPIAFMIANRNIKSTDYSPIEHLFRPGHADYTYFMKYGLREHRGGGRASARETAARVVAGCIASQLLSGVRITTQIAEALEPQEADTAGGIVQCRIEGLPAGVGEPLYGKLNAQLAAAMMSIPSAIGFEMGAGFAAARMRGSEYIDRWNTDGSTRTNHCGGVQGGISNGMPVEMRVAFHPVPTLPQEVEMLSEDGRLEKVLLHGRHDRRHVHRAAVVVEAMAALCIINLLPQKDKIEER